MGNGRTTTCSRYWNYLEPWLLFFGNSFKSVCYVPSYVLPRDLYWLQDSQLQSNLKQLQRTVMQLWKIRHYIWWRNSQSTLKGSRTPKEVIQMKHLRCSVTIHVIIEIIDIDLSQDKNQHNVFPNDLCVIIYWISSGKCLCFLKTCTF